ncbi:MAG: methyltransferase domain-containing protein [Candidatus Latescibacteria bacterium]|nr:methyltransferase domain-containing protein [Candidatus Latescibacterota bacterium]
MSVTPEKNRDTLEIKSYADFRRLIKGQTSKSMHDLYDDLYYQKHVGNKEVADSYFKTLGLGDSKYTKIIHDIAHVGPGEKILDIGCGRGEMVFISAHAGADATGIDFADSAIKIANEMRLKHSPDIQARTRFIYNDAGELDFEKNYFDKVFLVDVVEHVSYKEMADIFMNVKRVLKPDGKLIINTAPNVLTRTIGFKIKAAVYLLTKGKIPEHPIVTQFNTLKSDSEYDEHKILLHINEQSVFSLRRALKNCGYETEVWLEHTRNPWENSKNLHGRLLSSLYNLYGLKYIFGTHINAIASPK